MPLSPLSPRCQADKDYQPASVECLTSVLEGIARALFDDEDSTGGLEVSRQGRGYANRRFRLADLDREVQGILFGRREEGRAYVRAFRRSAQTDTLPGQTRLSEEARQAIVKLIVDSRADPALKEFEPLGWFRAHHKRQLNLSQKDHQVFDYFFDEPGRVGLVLRFSEAGSARARLYVRAEEGHFRSQESAPEISFGSATHHTAPVRSPVYTAAVPYATTAITPPRYPSRPRTWPGLLILSVALPLGYWWINRSPDAGLSAPLKTPPAQGVLQTQDSKSQPQTQDLSREGKEAYRLDEPLASQSLEENQPEPAPQPAATPKDRRPASSEHSTAAHLRALQALRERREAAKASRRRDTRESKKLFAASGQRQTTPLAVSQISRLNASSPGPPPSAVPKTFAASPPPEKTTARVTAPATPPENATPPKQVPAMNSSSSAPASEVPAIAPTPLTGTNHESRPAATAAPPSGRLIWTGQLRKNETVLIAGTHASLGSLSGGLPGKPVRITLWPGDFTDQGIMLYAHSPGKALEPPGPQNGWNTTRYVPDSARASEIEILEAPSQRNGWQRITFRAKGRATLVLVQWTLIQ